MRLSLLERERAVNTFLQTKNAIDKLELTSEVDFEECYHTTSREPYFYEAAYDEDLPCYGQSGFIVNNKCKPLPNPIPVKENGQCHLSDISSCVQSTKTQKGQNKETTDRQVVTNKWSCSPRCKPLSDEGIATIVNLFNADIPDLRKALEECDECPHIHSYKQEWHVLLKKE